MKCEADDCGKEVPQVAVELVAWAQMPDGRIEKVYGRWCLDCVAAKGIKEYTLEGTLPGRNDVCYCGSGKKFKKCHGR